MAESPAPDLAPWSPRAALAPRCTQHAADGVDGQPALRIAFTGDAQIGGWRREVGPVVAGRWYRAVAHVRGDLPPRWQEHAFARVRWASDDAGCFPEYLVPTGTRDGWTRLELIAAAPASARAAAIELLGRRLAGRGVDWSGVSFAPAAPPAPRPVRIATLHHLRRPSSGAAESLRRFLDDLAALPPGAVDLACLPEGLTTAGNAASFADVAEPIPGPTSERLAAEARRLGCLLVAGVYERDGDLLFNTAVLIGRDGRLIGGYRKAHLPQNEFDGGLSPGDRYPVFATDVGRIGLMVCWDVQFAEPARRLADAGAEIVCMPIAGGSEVLATARAIENHVHLVASSFDLRSMIVDPTGAIVGQSDGRHGFVRATVDLARRHVRPWIGEFGTSARVERRSDT